MSLSNKVILVGYCASKAELKQTAKGTPMAVLSVYTRDKIEKSQYINQPHRCVFFGSNANIIAEKCEKGRHIHLEGTLRTQRLGEGTDARYFTSIIVNEFMLSPRQNMKALKNTIREIIEENNIQSCNELDILKDEG